MDQTVAIVASAGARVLHDIDALWLAGAGLPPLRFGLAHSAAEATRLAERARRAGDRRIVAVGGDGTVNAVLQALEGDAELGIVAAGTGNDLARQLGLCDLATTEALALAIDHPAVPFDVGRCNDRRFANLVTVGPASAITTETPRELKSLLGAAAYMVHGITRLPTVEPFRAEVRGPGFSWSGHLLAAYVGNGGQAGGGFSLCPEARADDGLLDLALVPAEPLENLFDAVLAGRVGDESVVRHRGTAFEIETERPIPGSVDGERVDAARFRFAIEPRGLGLVVVPTSTPLLDGGPS